MEQEAERGRFLFAAKARFAEGAAGYELEQAFECAAFGEEKQVALMMSKTPQIVPARIIMANDDRESPICVPASLRWGLDAAT
jgi:hypothetical protein